MKKLTMAVAGLAAAFALSVAQAADNLEQIEQQGIERTAEGQQAQQQVDKLADTTRDLVDEYRAELRLVEGLQTYVGMLDHQLAGQQAEINTLQTSIGDVAVVERQILPLMSRMIDTLEEFIALDIPFLPEERSGRVAKLRELLRRSDVTVAEKCRRVFEAYQIETEYGRTIEAYKAKLGLADASYDAEFLRIGRTALLYRTVGADRLGYWDARQREWRDLDPVPYRRLIDKGLKVARQEIAPELVFIPLNPSEVEKP